MIPHPYRPPPPKKGADFSQLRQQSLKDIGRSYWEGRRRQRHARLIEVGGQPVLKENNYSLAQVGGREGRAGDSSIVKGFYFGGRGGVSSRVCV
jgi:hypothetical protein